MYSLRKIMLQVFDMQLRKRRKRHNKHKISGFKTSLLHKNLQKSTHSSYHGKNKCIFSLEKHYPGNHTDTCT